MKNIAVFGILFSWIFLVLLTFEIYHRPIVVRRILPDKWYQIEVHTKNCCGQITAKCDGSTIPLIGWGNDEFTIGFKASIEDGGIYGMLIDDTAEVTTGAVSEISPPTWIDSVWIEQ